MSDENNSKIQHVVFHKPGPAWNYGANFQDQPEELVMAHVRHYRQFFEQGKLEMGGPYLLADTGGMMVAAPSVSKGELEAFAAADPSVKGGLLEFEVRPWYVAMKRKG